MSKLRHYRSMDQPSSSGCVAIRKKTMTAVCFVCNLPIMSHQVGLVWSGGNGWDDLVREQASRRGSGESYLSSSRRDSNVAGRVTTPPPPPKNQVAKKRDSLAAPEFPNFRQEQRPSTSSAGSCHSDSVSVPLIQYHQQVDSACQALPPPTIITSSVTPPATSPTAPKGRRDSTTQCGRVNRRDSKAGHSPERAPRMNRLQRQATAFDESVLPGGSRRGSQPALSPDPPEDCERRASRRDSLSPDSASRGGRRDSRTHLSPDRTHERDGSPRRQTLRRQSSSAARHSPDSNSCGSSRDPSPCSRPPPLPTVEQNQRPAIRRQSTTEEILIARGFRRQSTTEEMIRCRNFRRQSSQSDDVCRPRKKTTIEEQWDQQGAFELISVEQETYEKYFYGTEHWNYFTSDEDLGPVILSIKQETLNGRDQFRILVRAGSYTVHGLIPASCVFADRYNREEVVRSLGKEVNLNPPLTLGQLPDTPEELLKLDQVFIKSELKVGVIFVKEDQYTEEQILDNNENSPLFDEFLTLLGDRVRLRGFDKYKGGLDTVHDLTGLFSVYTNWRNIEIMFHVSTLLPYEKHDPQKLQRKRHIGNDIVCVVFLEADNTRFSPACIKSHFLHTFILVRVSARIKHKPTRYEVSVVTRDEVGAYKPYLWEQSVFEKGPMFREWLLTKIVNGERASYSAPKFARMQERTRSQMLEDLVMNLSQSRGDRPDTQAVSTRLLATIG
ncbi:GL22981 [Drosophila persimilis]|uniref:GL22981 n=1 Tax=Drosophila persimilis TaxID=7234 RepID=B4H9U0_DROPE|nr:GL22981 [Drosophila persimilis]